MPSNTTFSVFYFVYVLESVRDGKRYIGYTHDLKKRFSEHVSSLVRSTRNRLPLKLVYFEACIYKEDAKRREHYLKTTQGRRFLGLRIQEYIRAKRLGPKVDILG